MNEQPPPAAPDSFAYLRSLAGERFNPTTLLAALLVLAVLYTLYFARAFLLPIVLAFLLALILMPAVRALQRLHMPRALAAALVTVALAASLGGLLAWIYDPAAQWIREGALHAGARSRASCAASRSRSRAWRRSPRRWSSSPRRPRTTGAKPQPAPRARAAQSPAQDVQHHAGGARDHRHDAGAALFPAGDRRHPAAENRAA